MIVNVTLRMDVDERWFREGLSNSEEGKAWLKRFDQYSDKPAPALVRDWVADMVQGKADFAHLPVQVTGMYYSIIEMDDGSPVKIPKL